MDKTARRCAGSVPLFVWMPSRGTVRAWLQTTTHMLPLDGLSRRYVDPPDRAGCGMPNQMTSRLFNKAPCMCHVIRYGFLQEVHLVISYQKDGIPAVPIKRPEMNPKASMSGSESRA